MIGLELLLDLNEVPGLANVLVYLFYVSISAIPYS